MPAAPEWIPPDSWMRYGATGWLGRWEREDVFAAMLPGLSAHLRATPPLALAEYVPGFQTLLLRFENVVPRQVPEAWWSGLGDIDSAKAGRLFTLAVRYDGPDLSDLAQAKGLTVAEVIRLHTAPVYTVRLLGFSPGFPYLGPLDPTLHLPRKATPRLRIAPGSVAIGGSHTGIYSVASPGGWHVIGRSNATLFNPDVAREERPDPTRLFLMQPGDRVRFEAVE